MSIHSDSRALRGARTRPRPRLAAVAAAAVLVPTLLLPAGAYAGTITLIGSGSSAAQPYMQELFKALLEAAPQRIQFKYNPDGGNAGVKDVQAGRSEFAINTRPPLPSDGGTTYEKLFLDGLCIAVNKSNSISNVSLGHAQEHLHSGSTRTGTRFPGSSLSDDDRPDRAQLGRRPVHVLPAAVLGGADPGLERPPGHLRRPRADRRREGSRTRSATSGSRTRAPASRS